MPDANQTSSNKESKISSDIHPGEAAAAASILQIFCQGSPCVIIMIALYTFCLTDGAECNVQLLKPGQSVAARMLAVIEDLEQAHATFQCREKGDATSVILNP